MNQKSIMNIGKKNNDDNKINNFQLSEAEADSEIENKEETTQDTFEENIREELPSPNQILLDSEQEFELEAQANLPQKSLLRSNIRSLLAGYCEQTSVASLLRKRWVIIFSAFVCCKVASKEEKTEKLVPTLFLIAYFCLGLLIVQGVFRYRFLKKANSGCQRIESIFEMGDYALLMIFILGLNLLYYRVINETFLFLIPLLFLLEIVMHLRTPSISQSQNNDIKFAMRLFYFLQSLLIAAKMNNLINSDWKTTLAFLWIYLGIKAGFAILTSLLLASVTLTAIVNLDTETLAVLKNKMIGYIWHISYYCLNVVCFVILLGVFQKIESDQENIMRAGLTAAKKLCIFLLISTTFLFPILKRFNVSPFEDLRATLQNQIVSGGSQKKYTLVNTENKKKIAFFSMISPTYFSLLKDFSEEMKEKSPQKISTHDLENQLKEENLCYICENNASNVILAGCGHGGVCSECAIKSIEQKNECMGCRKPIEAIYKIESKNSENRPEVIIKASELVQVIEI